MTTIFSGSCEDRFHSVPEVGSNTDDCQHSGGMRGKIYKFNIPMTLSSGTNGYLMMIFSVN